MTGLFTHPRLLVNGFKLSLRGKFTLSDNNEKIFFKTKNICPFWILSCLCIRCHLYSSKICKNWTDGRWWMTRLPWKCFNWQDEKKHKQTLTKYIFQHMLCQIIFNKFTFDLWNYFYKKSHPLPLQYSLLSPPSLYIQTFQLQKLNYQHFKTKVPEAWYEQEDKYNLCFFCPFFFFSFVIFLQYILLVFLFCSFCDLCKTWASSSDVCVVVRCAFSVCLLWSRPPLALLLQKEEKKPRSKATDSVWIFGISLFCPGFKKEFSLEGNLMEFPKVSNKYPHPKTKFVSWTHPSECSAYLLKKKGSLVWWNQDSLQQDECGFNVTPLQKSVSHKGQN